MMSLQRMADTRQELNLPFIAIMDTLILEHSQELVRFQETGINNHQHAIKVMKQLLF